MIYLKKVQCIRVQRKRKNVLNDSIVTADRSSVISVEGNSSQPHVFSDAERQEMHRNDVNAGRTHESMSRGKSGKVSNSQSRLNHYSNMQNLQRRMDQSGTTGYNPYRNE